MIYTKDHKTADMFDPFPFLGPKRKERIVASWAKLFRELILTTLPVEKVFSKYDPVMGAPTKELYAMLGLMVIQQMHDLTDEQAVDEFAYNIRWHYALNITSTADEAAYVCPKTLWTMRAHLTELNLYHDIFNQVTQKLAEVFAVDASKQRIDSVHIFSNMRHLGRIGLFVKTIKKFLVNLKRHHSGLYASLEKSLVDRYLTKRGEAVFSMVKPSESIHTLAALAEDVFALAQRFKANPAVTGMNSYQLLARLLKEQCHVESGQGESAKVSIKANQEVASDSLQNPSDPDAGYDGHKGQGYQVQLAENYNTAEEKNTLSLLTAVMVEPAHKSDAQALIPMLEATAEAGLKPAEVVADTLYGSDENCEQAKHMEVAVISPVKGRPADPEALSLTDFSRNPMGDIIACPQGHAPEKTKGHAGQYTVMFQKAFCESCACQKQCPIVVGKRGCYLRYHNKDLRLALRRSREATPEFRDTYRYRAGIEAAISQVDRLTGIKHLRVRGLAAVSFAAFLKAAGINILRAAAFRIQEKLEHTPIFVIFTWLFHACKRRFRFISRVWWSWQAGQALKTSFAAFYTA